MTVIGILTIYSFYLHFNLKLKQKNKKNEAEQKKIWLMRVLRFTFLLNNFLNKSNKPKFLKFINIGIFFSLFAVSSALITFYIENKIDKLEYSLSETHIMQKDNKQSIEDFVH